ncbi:putative lipid II flippase FtsW [bacterium]|nr:putative lipid II flippase FtsW [bacterium]
MHKQNIALLSAVFVLISIGIIMVFNTAAMVSILVRHLILAFIGLIFMFTSMNIRYEMLKKLGKPLLVLTIILLILVYFPHIGRAAGGARRWIRIGHFSMQPSELAKLVMIMYASNFLSKKRHNIKEFIRGFLPPMLVLGLVLALIIKNDLGSCVLIAGIVLTMMFISGANMKHLAIFFLASLPAIYIAIRTFPYRMKRIMVFLDPWEDPLGKGYQIIQSFYALGSGGWWGKGLGKGIQKLFYLPEAHTDFIFSIIGEELGFIGTLLIIMLYTYIIWRGIIIAYHAPDLYGHLLAIGITAMIAYQVIINIGVVTGLLPTKGTTLPFISFGGSSLIVNMIAIGLLINVSKEWER